MKNIRIYSASKYSGDNYKKTRTKDIYSTTIIPKDTGNCLALEGLMDSELSERLRNMEGWVQGTSDLENRYLLLNFDGQTYYRKLPEARGEKDWIFVKSQLDPVKAYVTSIVFEQEPEFGENDPDSQHISQYPLEDLLDKFNLELTDDWYDEENRNDSVNSYLEVAGDKLKDLKLFLDSVIGKHVFNKENGEIVDLIIE